MISIGILGYSGRMGQSIAAEIAVSENCTLAGGVVRALKPNLPKPEGVLITTDGDKVIALSEVVIDFSSAEVSADYARRAIAHKKPFMCGTTGLSAEGIEALRQASQQIPVLYAPNTSLSLAATKHVVALAAKLLGQFDYDVAILDEHHRMKKDAPSGTAKVLGEAVLAGNGGVKQPGYAAIRAGHIVGEHDVSFVGEGESIRIHHSVTDRRIFARGAVQAALWLHGKPAGFYSMDDVLGINS